MLDTLQPQSTLTPHQQDQTGSETGDKKISDTSTRIQAKNEYKSTQIRLYNPIASVEVSRSDIYETSEKPWVITTRRAVLGNVFIFLRS